MRPLSITLVAALGCSATPAPGLDAAVTDLGADARSPFDRTEVSAPQRVPLGGACTTDPPCDDGVFCNGAERCEQGRCVAGADPCDLAQPAQRQRLMEVCIDPALQILLVPGDGPGADGDLSGELALGDQLVDG